MNLFKTLIALSTLSSTVAHAQDTAKTNHENLIFAQVDKQPEYPGGIQNFGKYIGNSLKYPDVARLIGLEGKAIVTFVVDRNGTVTDVKPISCMGAGCESEAVRVIGQSPIWEPGSIKGRPVRVAYTVPINFSFNNGPRPSAVKIKDLKKSDYGFVINVGGKVYSLDEAEAAFGKTIDPKKIISAEQSFDPAHYPMPDKKEVYMIIMRS